MASDGLVHQSLPDELLFEIFSRMSPNSLGRAACVCRNWRYTIRDSVFWRNACLRAWQMSGTAENYRILQSKYDGSWRKMWLLRPSVRTDGLYVSQNTYTRAGVAEQKTTNPIHVVCNYRYIRFYHSGSFLYKSSLQKIKDVAKCMNFHASKEHRVFCGHYTLLEDLVEGAILYPGRHPTLWRIRLSLNGTTAGANNRMNLHAFVTSGANANEVNNPDEDILGVVQGWNEDAAHSADAPVILHKRSQSPFVFVPFEEVDFSFHFLSSVSGNDIEHVVLVQLSAMNFVFQS